MNKSELLQVSGIDKSDSEVDVEQKSLEWVFLSVVEAGTPGAEPVSRAVLETVLALWTSEAERLGPVGSFAAAGAASRLGLYQEAASIADRLGADWFLVIPPNTSARTRSIYAAIVAEAYLLSGLLPEATKYARMAVELLADVEAVAAAMRAQSLLAACLSLWGLPSAESQIEEALGYCGQLGITPDEAPWTLKLSVASLRSQGVEGVSVFDSASKRGIAGGISGDPFDWMIHEFDRAVVSLLERQFYSAVAITEAVWRQPGTVPVPPLLEGLLLGVQSLAQVHCHRFFSAIQLLEEHASQPGHSMCLEVSRSLALQAVNNPRSLLAATTNCVKSDGNHHMGNLIFVLLQRALAYEDLGDWEVADREFSRACHLLVEMYPVRGIPWPTGSMFDSLRERLEEKEPRFFLQLDQVMHDPINEVARLLAPFRPSELLPKLSYSEFVVAQWLGADMTLAQIAKKLRLSVNTVKTHSRAIYSKVGAHSRNEAVKKLEGIDFPLKSGR